MGGLTLDVADPAVVMERRLDTIASGPRMMKEGRQMLSKRLIKEPWVIPERTLRAISEMKIGSSMKESKSRLIFGEVAEKLLISPVPSRK